MRALLLLLTVSSAILALASCASEQTEFKLKFPYVDIVTRRDARPSVDDIRQIIALAKSRPDIKKPVDQIVMEAGDRVQVTAGNARQNGDLFTIFHAHKTNGRWTIIERSVNTGPATITE